MWLCYSIFGEWEVQQDSAETSVFFLCRSFLDHSEAWAKIWAKKTCQRVQAVWWAYCTIKHLHCWHFFSILNNKRIHVFGVLNIFICVLWKPTEGNKYFFWWNIPCFVSQEGKQTHTWECLMCLMGTLQHQHWSQLIETFTVLQVFLYHRNFLGREKKRPSCYTPNYKSELCRILVQESRLI